MTTMMITTTHKSLEKKMWQLRRCLFSNWKNVFKAGAILRIIWIIYCNIECVHHMYKCFGSVIFRQSRSRSSEPVHLWERSAQSGTSTDEKWVCNYWLCQWLCVCDIRVSKGYMCVNRKSVTNTSFVNKTHRCGSASAVPPCYTIEEKSKPYPDCCAQPVCPEENAIWYITWF